MIKLEIKFDEKIKKSEFNFLEIKGFQERPMLAVKAGMAIGYISKNSKQDKFIGIFAGNLKMNKI